MNIINLERIHKIYGEKVIFDEVSVGIQEGEKIGIVGINGTGKTTLLRILAGEETADSGNVICQSGLKLAYLPQNPRFCEGETILSYIGQENSWEVQSNLSRLGITNYSEKIENLSGGQKKKVALAKILAGSFDVLLLDEPTNHLDSDMIRWLEEYLNRFRGVIVMVTHDRYFLDKVTNRILEISRGNVYSYLSDYTGFLELKAQREEMEEASERKRRSILRIETEWAKRGCRARTTKQRARLERLEKLKDAAAPVRDQTVLMEAAAETRMGKKTIELHHISKGYQNTVLIRDFDYILLRGQHIGIVGPNGCGKSTLLKVMAGIIQPDKGSIEVGETVKIGYFSQEIPQMETKQRVIDYVKEIAEYVETSEGRISASQMLERFLFTPDMQYAPIEKLSGGEKKRLYLLGLLQTGANCLILDEPTNDLDIPTLTILEDYLNSFSGIVVTVSHDRYFLDNVAERIFAFTGDGRIRQYEGGYTDYMEAEEKTEKNSSVGRKETGAEREQKKEESKKAWKENRPVKLKFTYKEQKEYETIDGDITALEEKLQKLDEEMMLYATNSVKLAELSEEKEKTEQLLDEKTERWVYLSDLAERIEREKQ